MTVPTPLLERLATGIHHGLADEAATTTTAKLVSLVAPPDGCGSVEVGFWDLPREHEHTTDPLVGFLAPASWAGIGLVATGRARRLDCAAAEADRALTVCLWPRVGDVVSIVGRPGCPGDPMTGQPEGIVPDALARILGAPTPPPTWSTAGFVEVTWLERIAAARRPRPGRPRSWRWLADHHPLRGTGPTPSPEELAARTQEYGRERPWSTFLERHGATPLPAAVWGPPGGTVLPLGQWFDEGSISRWVFRHLPPADVVLNELVNGLAPPVARDLMAALAEVDTAMAPPT